MAKSGNITHDMRILRDAPRTDNPRIRDLRFRDVDWTRWNDLLDRVHHPKEQVTIALVGKYVDLHDAYLSVCEALRVGGFANHAKVVIRWVEGASRAPIVGLSLDSQATAEWPRVDGVATHVIGWMRSKLYDEDM